MHHIGGGEGGGGEGGGEKGGEGGGGEDGGGEEGGREGGGGEGGGGEGGGDDGKGEVGGGEVEGGGEEGSVDNPFPNAMTNSPYAKKKSVKANVSNEAYESAARTVSFCNQSMAFGITEPCSAIDEPLTSTLPVASTDDEPYAIVPCVSDAGS